MKKVLLKNALHTGYRLGTLITNRHGFVETGIPVNYDSDEPITLIAGSGEGKTQCLVIPNLLSWEGASVVLDVKGEIFETTSAWRENHVGPVFRFNPLDPHNSLHFNPLGEIRDHKDHLFRDANLLARHMIVSSDSKNRDPFWSNNARELLTGAIAVNVHGIAPHQRDFSKTLELMTGQNWKGFIRQLKSNADKQLRNIGNQLSSATNKKSLNDTLSTARTKISVWGSNQIRKVTTGQSDWETDQFRSENQGVRPPTLYIQGNPADMEHIAPVVRTMLGLHMDKLYEKEPKVKRRTLFMLDEMPTLGYMNVIENAFSTGRSYGISIFAIAQSMQQLERAYPLAKAMMTNAAVRLYMSPRMDDGTAQAVSEAIGYSKSMPGKPAEPIVRPELLSQGDYQDKIIALVRHSKPTLIKRKLFHDDEDLADLRSKAGMLPNAVMKAKRKPPLPNEPETERDTERKIDDSIPF